MVAKAIQSFGQNGPWLAGWLSNGQKSFVNLAQTCDERMLKISERYSDSCLSNGQITEKLLLQMASFQLTNANESVWFEYLPQGGQFGS